MSLILLQHKENVNRNWSYCCDIDVHLIKTKKKTQLEWVPKGKVVSVDQIVMML